MVEYDRLAPGEGLPVLERLTDRMRLAQPADDVLHVDLAVRAEVRIPTLVARELEQAMETVWRLSPRQPGSPRLRGYHHEFLQRYGTGRPVPLTELLSEEIGLGMPDTYRRDGGLGRSAHCQPLSPTSSGTACSPGWWRTPSRTSDGRCAWTTTWLTGWRGNQQRGRDHTPRSSSRPD